jgi:hypothetical protein
MLIFKRCSAIWGFPENTGCVACTHGFSLGMLGKSIVPMAAPRRLSKSWVGKIEASIN